MIKSYSLFKESNDSILSIVRDLQSEIEIEFNDIDTDLTEGKYVILLIWKDIESDKFHEFLVSRIDMMIDIYDIKVSKISLAVGNSYSFQLKKLNYTEFKSLTDSDYIGVDITFEN